MIAPAVTPLVTQTYWRASREPRYALLLALPLFVFYQILVALQPVGPTGTWRNGADVLLPVQDRMANDQAQNQTAPVIMTISCSRRIRARSPSTKWPHESTRYHSERALAGLSSPRMPVCHRMALDVPDALGIPDRRDPDGVGEESPCLERRRYLVTREIFGSLCVSESIVWLRSPSSHGARAIE